MDFWIQKFLWGIVKVAGLIRVGLKKLDLSVSGLRVVVISFIMVTLDLLITRYGLSIGLYEKNIFGNNPVIGYSVCLSLTYFLYMYEKHFNKKHIASLLYALLPVIAIINNLYLIAIISF